MTYIELGNRRRKGFNPHTHEGCDSELEWKINKLEVSIHTPTKGVTVCTESQWAESVVSIHTPTKGVTTSTVNCSAAIPLFQSTHPRRVWHVAAVVAVAATCFNPHTHEGCDMTRPTLLNRQTSFNPHTHEGCDFRGEDRRTAEYVFQSTHPRRVWPLLYYRDIQLFLFQSTHPRRVWLHSWWLAQSW